MAEHPAKTILGERVLYFPQGGLEAHVAFVIKTHDDPHMACLVFYCPATHQWKEVYNVRFGKADDRAYYVNPEW